MATPEPPDPIKRMLEANGVSGRASGGEPRPLRPHEAAQLRARVRASQAVLLKAAGQDLFRAIEGGHPHAWWGWLVVVCAANGPLPPDNMPTDTTEA